MNEQRIADAVAGVEAWLETVRQPGGYGGPAVGPRAVSLRFAGPAYDDRLAAMLDARRRMAERTGRPEYLDTVQRDLADLCGAQLGNGSFRNSQAEYNPLEGGMPHEAAVMAAAGRAAAALQKAGRKAPSAWTEVLERFVRRRLVNELWCKRLKTFNDCLQSTFDGFVPQSVAAAIEVLLQYRTASGARDLDPYWAGAARSLQRLQWQEGAARGALPLSNQEDSIAVPALAATCLPALEQAAEAAGDEHFHRAAEALAAFVRSRPVTTWTAATARDGSCSPAPLLFGPIAGALDALHRAGRLQDDDADRALAVMLPAQHPSGAFHTAKGFGGRSVDWRDVLPCCGPNARLYALLAVLHPGSPGRFDVRDWDRPVRVSGGAGRVQEDGERITIRRGSRTMYAWARQQRWAEICEL